MTKTCKSCLHWQNETDGNALARCSSPKFHYGYDVVNSDIQSNEVLIGGSNWERIVSGPDFGCVHHTEKPVGANAR